MNLNKNETEEFKKILDIISENTLNNAGITKYISAIVYEINENGSCNLYIPPDTKNIITGVPNKSGEYLHIGDSVEVCTKNGKMNNSWIAVKHGNSSGSPTYENLNIINDLNVGGNTQLKGATHVHIAQGTPGTDGYILIATIGVTKPYANAPLHMMIGRRGAPPTDFYFGFSDVNNTDPGVAYAYCTYPTVDIYYYKKMESTWNIYVKKSEAYDKISILQYEKDITYEGNNYVVSFDDYQDSDLPQGAIYVDSNLYPLGSVYVTSTNNEPTHLGGRWKLFDKALKSQYIYSNDETYFTKNTTNCTSANFRMDISDHNIIIDYVFNPKVTIADTTLTIGTFKLSDFTDCFNPYDENTNPTGSKNTHVHYSSPWSDGGENFVMMQITNAGVLQTLDTQPSSVAAGNNTQGQIVISSHWTDLKDAQCDRFYWKRVLPSEL